MSVRIFSCGDIVNTQISSGLLCSAELSEIIKTADYSVCNFEAPIEGFGSPISKSGIHIQNKTETINGLKKQGFDAILIANNHMMDYGEEALKQTKIKAEKAELDVVGAGLNFEEAYKPLVIKIQDISFGIINACEAQFGVLDYFQNKNTAGYAWINHNQIDKNIIKLKRECDFVLVYAHAGLENYTVPQKEWRERYRFLCDLGADVVVGGHPHVPQGYEEYNGALIFYSLGNFYFDRGRWASSVDSSYAIMLEFIKGGKPTFTPVFHITDIDKRQVRLADHSTAIDLESLSNQLGINYQNLHDDMTLHAYRSVKANLLRALAPFPLGSDFKSTVKELAATILGRRKNIDKSTLALHLFRNEAYYFVARHALELEQKSRLEK